MDNKETYRQFVEKSLRDLFDLTVSTYDLSKCDFMKDYNVQELFVEAYKNDLPVGQLALQKFGQEIHAINKSEGSSVDKLVQLEALGKKFAEELSQKAS